MKDYTSMTMEEHSAEMANWDWAVNEQGYEGSFDDWMRMPADERAQYEDGAQGIGTV